MNQEAKEEHAQWSWNCAIVKKELKNIAFESFLQGFDKLNKHFHYN